MAMATWCSRGWLLLALTACSAGSEGSAGGGGQSGANNGPGTPSTSGFGSSGDCVDPPKCSDDLHSVLCGEQVIQTCGPSEACANGACVPACEATKLTKSSVGCEYYATNPDVFFSTGACYAAFIANTWTTPAKLTVEHDGKMLDLASFARIPSGSGTALTYAPLPNGEVPVGEIAILFLAQFEPGARSTPACPTGITTALSGKNAALHGTGITQPFRISSNVPIVAYDIFPYGGGPSEITSATLLLPTSTWDTNYIGIVPYDSTPIPTAIPWYNSWLQIIANEDATDVTISPTSAIEGGPGVAPTPLGVPVTYSLSRGQVLQLSQPALLGGSPIQSTKPVGVVGGNGCMRIPAFATDACDAGHQMIPPVRALGSEYVAVPHRARFPGSPEQPPWRIVGVVDNTFLTYDPPVAGAPTTIHSGQIVEFRGGAFVVKSQDQDHPFYVSGHMTGCAEVSTDLLGDCRGDPETVNVVPSVQYLSDYVFFTDPTYPETPLTLVRKRTDQGFADVTLKCAGVVGGWAPVGSAGDYEFTYVDISVGNYNGVGGCSNGRQEASSKGPFGVTVWGWGSGATGGSPATALFPYSQYVSYGYPAGARVQPVTEVVVPPVPK